MNGIGGCCAPQEHSSMSYNITTWRTKKVKDLYIPLALLTSDTKYGYTTKVLGDDPSQGFVRLESMERVWMVGHIEGDNMHVREITCQGEGSGTTFDMVLLPAFAHSTGSLRVKMVWEGGDSISELLVQNGIVSHKNIEL
jgi:hypothetical protein